MQSPDQNELTEILRSGLESTTPEKRESIARFAPNVMFVGIGKTMIRFEQFKLIVSCYWDDSMRIECYKEADNSQWLPVTWDAINGSNRQRILEFIKRVFS